MRQESLAEPFGLAARGMAQSGLRIANERAILTLIALHAGISNADLARLSGLGPQTTSRIVTDLEEKHLIRRGEVLRGRRGQPATPFSVNPEGAYSIGVELGWRHLEVLLFDMVGNRMSGTRIHYAYPDADQLFALAADAVEQVVAQIPAGHRDRLLGIGLAVPHQIARNIHHFGAPPEIVADWADVDVAAELAAVTRLPVFPLNDGSAACWAELSRNTITRRQGYAYFYVGPFVGAGVVTDGQLWEGQSGNAANLGSIVVQGVDGQPTFLHLVGSLSALEERLRTGGYPVPDGDPLQWDWAGIEPVVAEWLQAASSAFAQAIISTQAVADIHHAIVDGAMPRPILDRLLAGIEQVFEGFKPMTAELPLVELGHLGSSAAATGASHRSIFNAYFARAWKLLAT